MTLWALLSQDMQDRGMSIQRQAMELDRPYSTVYRWVDGSEPRFEEGLLLLELHSQVCGCALTHERLGSDWLVRFANGLGFSQLRLNSS